MSNETKQNVKQFFLKIKRVAQSGANPFGYNYRYSMISHCVFEIRNNTVVNRVNESVEIVRVAKKSFVFGIAEKAAFDDDGRSGRAVKHIIFPGESVEQSADVSGIQ